MVKTNNNMLLMRLVSRRKKIEITCTFNYGIKQVAIFSRSLFRGLTDWKLKKKKKKKQPKFPTNNIIPLRHFNTTKFSSLFFSF